MTDSKTKEVTQMCIWDVCSQVLRDSRRMMDESITPHLRWSGFQAHQRCYILPLSSWKGRASAALVRIIGAMGSATVVGAGLTTKLTISHLNFVPHQHLYCFWCELQTVSLSSIVFSCYVPRGPQNSLYIHRQTLKTCRLISEGLLDIKYEAML